MPPLNTHLCIVETLLCPSADPLRLNNVAKKFLGTEEVIMLFEDRHQNLFRYVPLKIALA